MTKSKTIEAFLKENEQKELLRFSSAGSVDDGKSTMLGHLLHDAKGVYEDQLASIKNASKQMAKGEIDYALFTDGLKAEREQGITIDVAYRYFSTPKRKFIVADTPGHEQYTRNMATGASTAQLAVILIDARLGVLTQSKRHLFISSLMGIPHIIVAVNKMDLVDYSEKVFAKIKKEFTAFARKLSIKDLRFVPISALVGDNVAARDSEHMPWYKGESLLELLENIYIGSDNNTVDLRYPVQYVLRPNLDFRGFCGQVASGVLKKGDEVIALPSGKRSRVKSIVTMDGDLERALPKQSVTVTLEDEIDISRGDMLVRPNNLPQISRHIEATLIWMSEQPMDPKGGYFIKQTTMVSRCRIDELRYKIDVNTLHRQKADHLELNEIGRVSIVSNRKLMFDPFEQNRATGSFILIDAITNNTVGAGMIIRRESADDAPNLNDKNCDERLRRHPDAVGAAERSERLGQKAQTIWITGLVASGKSDLAYALEKEIFEKGGLAYVLDGEDMRLGLCRDLDFTACDKAEHIRRVAEAAKLLNEAGVTAICAFVSPFRKARAQAAEIIGKERFKEIFVDASLDYCAKHDDKELYKGAEEGSVKGLAGVNAPYEAPKAPWETFSPETEGKEACAFRILEKLRKEGKI
jgi:adenylyl-sulfate kinase